MGRLRVVVLIGWCVATAGCAVEGVYNDQDRIRTTLLDLYTTQILDNLIRASNGLPIVQIDYTNATAQLTLKDTAGASDMYAISNPTVLQVVAGSTATVLKTTMNTAMGNLSIDRANQVALTATPLTAGDDVYNAYRDFLAIPGSLQVTREAPPPGAAHLCKRCGSTYYWVPVAYQKAFLLLALTTTAQRGQPPAPLDNFYTVNITEVDKALDLQNDKFQRLVVKLDKAIPVDNGVITISVGAVTSPTKAPSGSNAPSSGAPPGSGIPPGAASAPGIPPASGNPPSGAPAKNSANGGDTGGGSAKGILTFRMATWPDTLPRGAQSDTISITYDADQAVKQGFNGYLDFVNRVRMQPLAAQIYLSRHRPQVPVPNDVMNRIEFSLQQIQFNQTRLGTGP